MEARATSAMNNNNVYTINTLHDKRAPHATATIVSKTLHTDPYLVVYLHI